MRTLLTAVPLEDAGKGMALWERLTLAVEEARACMARQVLKILIVEDESWAALDSEWVCRKLGHEVIGPAATREEAVRLIERERPDVVLMDVSLAGGVDGRSVADEISRRFSVRSVLVSPAADVAGRACEASPAGVIQKPFAPETLAAAIKGVLR